MRTTIVLAVSLLATAFLMPTGAASAEMGNICLPVTGDEPVRGCTSYGTQNRDVYRPDASVESWTLRCVYIVCAYTPDATTSSVYLLTAPSAYSQGSIEYRCIKGQWCTLNWDTRTILDSLAFEVNAELLA